MQLSPEVRSLFVCQHGNTRSKAAATVCCEMGYNANHYPGGTNTMANLTPAELKETVDSYNLVVFMVESRDHSKHETNTTALSLALALIGINTLRISCADFCAFAGPEKCERFLELLSGGW